MGKTNIEWTATPQPDGALTKGATWNPVTGCTRVSAGCDNCYAVAMTRRLAGYGNEKYAGLVNPGKGHFNGVVKTHGDALAVPLRRRKPETYFVNSMSDLFHVGVPFDFIDRVFAVMALCPQHTFQILTKRPERMAEYLAAGHLPLWKRWGLAGRDMNVDAGRWIPTFRGVDPLPWPLPNVWLGTSVEDQAVAHARVPHLLDTPAAVRFLSCEPLLEEVSLADAFADALGYLTNPEPRIHWIIVGGESGPRRRPFDCDWARSIRDECAEAGVAFYMKQVDKVRPIPPDLFVREFPQPAEVAR